MCEVCFLECGDKEIVEIGDLLMLKFDVDGLIVVVVIDVVFFEVLMVGYMNVEVLKRILEIGEVWYWSWFWQSYWKKGEILGQVQKVQEIFVDCD